NERKVLAHIKQNTLSVTIPKLVAEGRRDDGWRYVILTKVSGTTLENFWPKLPIKNKLAILKKLGKVIAEVHAIPIKGIQHLEPSWNAFLQAQRFGFATRQQRLGMPEWFWKEGEALIQKNLDSLTPKKPVIL